jgi:hypothetical protein
MPAILSGRASSRAWSCLNARKNLSRENVGGPDGKERNYSTATLPTLKLVVPFDSRPVKLAPLVLLLLESA